MNSPKLSKNPNSENSANNSPNWQNLPKKVENESSKIFVIGKTSNLETEIQNSNEEKFSKNSLSDLNNSQNIATTKSENTENLVWSESLEKIETSENLEILKPLEGLADKSQNQNDSEVKAFAKLANNPEKISNSGESLSSQFLDSNSQTDLKTNFQKAKPLDKNYTQSQNPQIFLIAAVSILVLFFLLLMTRILLQANFQNTFFGRLWIIQNSVTFPRDQKPTKSENFENPTKLPNFFNSRIFGSQNFYSSDSSANFPNDTLNYPHNPTIPDSMYKKSNSSQNFSSPNFSSISLQFQTLQHAKTEIETTRGLMFRDNLCDKCGMFFEFEDENYRRFWMKNTLVDLDIIFIDQSGQIINIASAKAEKAVKVMEDYPGYSSLRPAKYVLEIPLGMSSKFNLQNGTILNLENLKKQLIPMKKF